MSSIFERARGRETGGRNDAKARKPASGITAESGLLRDSILFDLLNENLRKSGLHRRLLGIMSVQNHPVY